MSFFRKRGARRTEIRKNRPDTVHKLLNNLRADGRLMSLWVALGFCVATMAIMLLHDNVVAYRPGQYVSHDIVSRVPFTFNDKDRFAEKQRDAREREPRVYKTDGDVWKKLEDQLAAVPGRVAKLRQEELPAPLKDVLDAGSLAKLQDYAAPSKKPAFDDAVHTYTEQLRKLDLVILSDPDRRAEAGTAIVIPGRPKVETDSTYSVADSDELTSRIDPVAQKNFLAAIAPKIVLLTVKSLTPTHALDEAATTAAQNEAAGRVPVSEGDIVYNANEKFIPKGEITTRHWQLLRAENEAFLKSLDRNTWWSRAGLLSCVGLITIVLSAYVAKYQPRVVRNHARSIAIAGLLVSMLLLAQLAAAGSSPTYVFGLAPTIVVAMILTIAYDQRFAVGIGTIHGILVTLALGESMAFFLILWSGVLTCCFLLDDIRTRSRLIEVGGATALAMIAATCAAGFMKLDPAQFIMRNCLYAGAAGLGVGFLVLGILPFIEKAFRITTSMTLLELADASQPLLRRLALEAPGTYNHSLQVATLSEEAADAIGGNSLICRVGSYYHDIGKINKADYFIENQVNGQNRHINLTPNVSLLIIIGHVKDGIELAREYNLPTSLFPFIQQHHGTTLVEFFYHRACTLQGADGSHPPAISDTQYRYPGPKPKSKEIALVMLSDCVESATRAMSEPTAARIETLVHELAMKRLMDGQFDECDLTFRELELVERSLTKTLLGIYHGRIAYPTAQQMQAAQTTATARSA